MIVLTCIPIEWTTPPLGRPAISPIITRNLMSGAGRCRASMAAATTGAFLRNTKKTIAKDRGGVVPDFAGNRDQDR